MPSVNEPLLQLVNVAFRFSLLSYAWTFCGVVHLTIILCNRKRPAAKGGGVGAVGQPPPPTRR